MSRSTSSSRDHLVGELGVVAHERIDTVLDHRLCDFGHPREIDIGLELRDVVKFEGALADVHRVVADSFEVGGNLEAGSDEAQIAGSRLMEREQADALLVVIGVHLVDFVVALNHFAGVFAIAIDQRLDRLGDLPLHQSAHLEQTGAQAAQILFVLSVGMLRLCTVHILTSHDLSRTAR